MLALEVIGAIGDERCVPPAIASLRDPSENVRWQAVKTLGALRDQRATEPLLALLREDHRGSDLWCVTVVEALERIGDPRAGDALSSLLDHPSEEMRTSAATALDATGWRPIARADEARRLVALCRWDELAALGWEIASGPLLGMLKDGDYKGRRAAVAGLAHFGASYTLEPLIGALMDADQEVASAAAEALALLGSAEAIDAMMDRCTHYAPTGGYRNDPNAPHVEQARADEWVKPLETLIQSASDTISAVDLRRLSAMRDETFNLRVEYDTPGYGDGADDFSIAVHYSRVRHPAEDILRRRGLGQ